MQEALVDETERKRAIELLDRLLGVEARKFGAAARLPAVIRAIESLEPAGGKQFPVFPASYAGDGQNAPPVYDLNGIEYGPEMEVIHAKDRDRYRRQQVKARQCTMDSPQSQANRTEAAFIEDEELKALVPQASAAIPRAEGKKTAENVLRLPHRIADFRIRLSNKREDVKAAISDLANGNALKLLRIMPTSVIFGFWDSRGDEAQHKHARLLLSRIDAFDVVPCTKHAIYSGPYSKDEFAEIVLGNATLAVAGQEEAETNNPPEAKPSIAKKAFDKMAERGFTAALSGGGLGGVLVEGKIERLSLLSLTDIARLSCAGEDGKRDDPLTNAARRYVFALAALADGHPRATGSHRLRSGCELVATKDGLVVELRGGDGTYPDAAELCSLFMNRDALMAVATEAKERLAIPSTIEDFVVTGESLKSDFDGTTAKTNPETKGTRSSTKDKGSKSKS